MKLHTTSFGIPAPHHTLSEDAFAVTQEKSGGVLCVLSDGVGAARDPRRCSERVVRLISENFAARPSDCSPHRALERLIEEANLSLCREGAYLDGATSMQATLAAIYLSGNQLYGINVGDSPVLLIRQGNVERLSLTHSIRNGDGRDVLTNAVGMSSALSTHHFTKEICVGDLIVVTSDGLTNLLLDQEISELARTSASARSMVRKAASQNSSSDHDDLSAILIEVQEIDPLPLCSASIPQAPRPMLTKGKIIDGFQLLRPMGHFMNVWLATKEQQRFVLKFISEEAARDESGSLYAQFAREAWNASRFKEDYFITSFLPKSGSPHYYVMEYVEAPSLSFLLKTRKLASEEVVELGSFLAKACQRLLSSELVHGDIKPDNILIFSTGEGLGYKLLDLGIASPIFTDTGVSGTPSYLAPERFSGAVITERTEIFSIGATLYEMLTGRPPFGLIERFQKPQFSIPQCPSHWSPNVPIWLDAVVMKCLSLKEHQRFQHFSELLFALEHPELAPLEVFQYEPLLSRHPNLFYKVGFWLLLAMDLFLLIKLSSKP